MRIVAGEFKSRIIESPSEKTTRPTTDRVRESVFSSVYSRLPELADVDVLDAFAGSGALGIEALSRGARSCTLVEHDRAARQVLEKNLASLGLKAPRVHVIAGDAFELATRSGWRGTSAAPYEEPASAPRETAAAPNSESAGAPVGRVACCAPCYGLVLLDPPYAEEPARIHGLLLGLSNRGKLADGCVIVYEHALQGKQAVAEEFDADGRFAIDGQKKYGKIGVTYLKYHDREE